MYGMDRLTGRQLDGLQHVRQSVADILTTPLGSRLWRRDYGSRLPDLIDKPTDAGTLLDIYTASADAIAKWEPRFRLKRIRWAELLPDYGFVGLVLFGDTVFDQAVDNIRSTVTPVALDVAFAPAPDSATPTNPYWPASRVARVSYDPPASWDGSVSTVTLPDAALDPIMLFANGVQYNVAAVNGQQLTVGYDLRGDLVTVYYMVEGNA